MFGNDITHYGHASVHPGDNAEVNVILTVRAATIPPTCVCDTLIVTFYSIAVAKSKIANVRLQVPVPLGIKIPPSYEGQLIDLDIPSNMPTRSDTNIYEDFTELVWKSNWPTRTRIK